MAIRRRIEQSQTRDGRILRWSLRFGDHSVTRLVIALYPSQGRKAAGLAEERRKGAKLWTGEAEPRYEEVANDQSLTLRKSHSCYKKHWHLRVIRHHISAIFQA